MKDLHKLCYCHAARRSARFLSRLYDRHLAPSGISIQQLSILAAIENNPDILIAELTDRMVMERTTLVRALKPLEAAGLLETKPSGIGRSLTLKLTRAGKRKLEEAIPLWQTAQREFESLFGTTKATQLREELKRVSKLA